MSFYISYEKFISMYEAAMCAESADELIKKYNNPSIPPLTLYQAYKVSKMNISDLRHVKSMSQKDYAKYLGTSTSTVERWEAGNAKPVECTMRLLAYAAFLEIMNQ